MDANVFYLQRLQEIKEKTDHDFAIQFPASYFDRIFDKEYRTKKRTKMLQFTDVLPVAQGQVTKTAPTDLIFQAQKYFNEHDIPYRLIALEVIEFYLKGDKNAAQ